MGDDGSEMDDEDDFLEGLDVPGADEGTTDPDGPPGDPDYRATVVGARVTVIPWMSFLADGPLQRPALLERERAGVTIADLTVLGSGADREVVARFLARGGGTRAERALVRWAAATGHRRLWLPSRVVALEPPARFGKASTTCSNCGYVYRDGAPEFWARVRGAGTFPTYCLVCGGDLPQWTTRHA